MYKTRARTPNLLVIVLGEFVGMFRRSTANTDKRRDTRTSTSASDDHIVPSQNEKNAREKHVRDKTDGKDGKMMGFFKKIIGKEDERVGKNSPSKSQAKPAGMCSHISHIGVDSILQRFV